MQTKVKSLFISLAAQLGLFKRDSQRLSAIPLGERLKVALAGFIALFVVTFACLQFADATSTVVLLASMGASSVLLFGLPNSPLAKPWSFVGGHLISATVGLICSHIFTDLALMAAVTIGLVLFVMYIFECMHPPGGATALVPVIAASDSVLGYDFLLYPVALSVFVMLAVSMLLNKVLLKRGLQKPTKKFDPVHLHHDQSPLKRLGLQPEDLLNALNSFDTVVDISEQDLERLYHQAQLNAYQRKSGEIRCVDIMSRDLITVTPDTAVASAWQLLRKHKISMLPVTDSNSQLLGVVATVDFLKNLKVPHYWGLLRHLNNLLLKNRHNKHYKRSVEDIMATNLTVVHENDHIAALIPILSDQGLHHIPVLNGQQKLVGIITQSDLIAALFSNQLANT
ncbi:HPP family protein [Rheinheimera salexigens]|uniref:Phage tail protein n=1 Tax=Rheinheimera salexigens TaxID=1628148 RepID=A0A1E7Q7U0_9GAMM|nr:HPP family protein [Rheinheimera salexigens]OEY70197.1 phage tail protein [Rheinheimera salexigens]